METLEFLYKWGSIVGILGLLIFFLASEIKKSFYAVGMIKTLLWSLWWICFFIGFILFFYFLLLPFLKNVLKVDDLSLIIACAIVTFIIVKIGGMISKKISGRKSDF